MDLFKYRSITSCMKASYNELTSHSASLLRKTWWAVLAYAVVMATCIYFRFPNKALHDWGEGSPMTSFVLQSIVYALTTVTSILTGATFWSWVNKRRLWWNLKHYFIISLVADAVVGGVAVGTSWAGMTLGGTAFKVPVVIFSAVATIAVLVPFGYLQPRVMLLGAGEKLRPWHSYLTGFRYGGGIFMLGFLGALITGIVACILFLPGVILFGAQTISQLGALDGDPLGTPSYFTPLLLVVTSALLFVFQYVGFWLSLAFAHLYGAYSTQEAAKEEMKKNKQIAPYQQ